MTVVAGRRGPPSDGPGTARHLTRGQQGYGIGSALLRSFLEDIDQSSPPAFLEADDERIVVLYERFGFRVVSQEKILGVDTRFLWRDRP